MKTDVWSNTMPAPAGERAPVASEPQRSPLLDVKVMMVDDEPLMTSLIQTHLEDAGYTNFVSTSDPRRTLELLHREEPGVLLLDLKMPQLSGFDVLEAIRADRHLRYTPVIVLTAATGADAKLRALQLGATDFLSKPVDASELVLRVRNTLAFHQYSHRTINYDAATGLPNERLFERGIDLLLSRQPVIGGLVALFSIEVPECRLLRESLGAEATDHLARTLAHRLQRIAEAENPPSALSTSPQRAPRVARLAADRFALVLEDLDDGAAVEAIARRLPRVLAEPVTLGAHEVAPAVWAGVALGPNDGVDAETLRQSADLAASHARRQNTVPVQFASPELNARSLKRLTLGTQLRLAMQRDELRLHYQPKIDMASGRIVGAEALVRWQHPEHGLLAPAHFVPMAEELGLITQVGRWVAHQACRDAAAWAHAGLPPLKVAINAAEPQFRAGDLPEVLQAATAEAGLAPETLVVELTERMLIHDAGAAIDLMHALKRLGVTLSIDDFGTGYSSLSYLKRFPLDELKIDQSFVTDLPGRDIDEAIVRAVIELGHSLNLKVVAEGVESRAQFDCLRRLGCDEFQGFFFSTPLTREAFVALVQRHHAAAA